MFRVKCLKTHWNSCWGAIACIYMDLVERYLGITNLTLPWFYYIFGQAITYILNKQGMMYCPRVSDDMNDVLCIRGNVTIDIFLICVWAPPAGHNRNHEKCSTQRGIRLDKISAVRVVRLYGSYCDDSLWKRLLLSKCIGIWGFKYDFSKWRKYEE